MVYTPGLMTLIYYLIYPNVKCLVSQENHHRSSLHTILMLAVLFILMLKLESDLGITITFKLLWKDQVEKVRSIMEGSGRKGAVYYGRIR